MASAKIWIPPSNPEVQFQYHGRVVDVGTMGFRFGRWGGVGHRIPGLQYFTYDSTRPGLPGHGSRRPEIKER